MSEEVVKTTFDGWRILRAAVQLVGLAPSAEQRNRSQATIRYVIARFQPQVGIKLIGDRSEFPGTGIMIGPKNGERLRRTS